MAGDGGADGTHGLGPGCGVVADAAGAHLSGLGLAGQDGADLDDDEPGERRSGGVESEGAAV